MIHKLFITLKINMNLSKKKKNSLKQVNNLNKDIGNTN